MRSAAEQRYSGKPDSFAGTPRNRQRTTVNRLLFLSRIFIFSRNSCRLGEIASRNFVVERLRQKYCLSEASLFLSSENDKILADLSAAASFFCFSFLREKRERKFLCRTYGTLILLWACLQAFRASLSIPAYILSSLTGLIH